MTTLLSRTCRELPPSGSVVVRRFVAEAESHRAVTTQRLAERPHTITKPSSEP